MVRIKRAAPFSISRWHLLWAAPTLAWAAPSLAWEDCCTSDTPIPYAAGEADMATRASRALQASFTKPASGWQWRNFEAERVETMACRANMAFYRNKRAGISANAMYSTEQGGYSQYYVYLVANKVPAIYAGARATTYLETIGTPAKVQPTNRITSVTLVISRVELSRRYSLDANESMPIPEDHLAAMKATIDRAKIQALIDGGAPDEATSLAMVTQAKADKEAFDRGPARAGSRSRSSSSGNSNSGSSSSSTGRSVGESVLRRGVGRGLGKIF